MKPMWMKELLRNADDEGGGGGSADINSLVEQNRQMARQMGEMANKMGEMERRGQQSQQASRLAQLNAAVETEVTNAENDVNSAETALTNALEAGEPADIAKAQRQLADKSAQAERKRAERDQFRREMQDAEKRQGGQRTESATAQPSMDTSNLDSWKDQNKTWYGIDSEMTKVSHEIDQGIRAAGTYTVGSKDYFDAINRAMKQRFPDRYEGAPASASARGDADPMRPGARRYDREVQRSMEAFGMSPEAWDKARDKAAQKGLVSETPARGRVRA